MNTQSRLLLSLLFAAVFAACTSTSSVNSTSSLVEKSAEQPITINSAPISLASFVELPNGMSNEEFARQRLDILDSPSGNRMFILGDNLKKTSSWQEADKQAKSCLNDIKDGQNLWFFEQIISASILGAYFLPLIPTIEVQQAAEFYVNILLKYDNYNEVVIMSKLLPMLKGYWSNEKLYGVSLKHYQRINDKVPASLYVIREFGFQAEKLAKQSPEKYTSSSEIAMLANNVKKQFWQEKVEGIFSHKQPNQERIPQTLEEHKQQMHNSKVAIALLVEYFESQSGSNK